MIVKENTRNAFAKQSFSFTACVRTGCGVAQRERAMVCAALLGRGITSLLMASNTRSLASVNMSWSR